jgi:CRISPR/Cas system-associated exonuclease Cas4 (RecB family)
MTSNSGSVSGECKLTPPNAKLYTGYVELSITGFCLNCNSSVTPYLKETEVKYVGAELNRQLLFGSLVQPVLDKARRRLVSYTLPLSSRGLNMGVPLILQTLLRLA